MGEPRGTSRDEARRAAIDELAAALRQLRLAAGQPTFRAMAKASGQVSHTTLHDAVSGTRLPSWPTVEAFVRACGGDVAEWQERWARAAAAAQLPAQTSAPEEPVPGPLGGPAPSGEHQSTRWQGLRLVAALVGGILIGAGGTLGILGLSRTAAAPSAQDCPIGDDSAHRQPFLQSVALIGPVAGAPRLAADAGPTPSPSWVGRTGSDQEVLAGTSMVVPVFSPVTQGDALIVTMMLTATCPGQVTVTDTQGDRFELVGDETDTRRHRVLVFAAFGVRPLTTADSVRVSYPHASKYHIAVDEFRGISAMRGSARAHGESGGTAFTTSSHPITCTSGDLVIGAVGTNTGTAPEFSSGWTTLPVLKLSSYRLTTATRIASATGPCAATGRTTAQWGAVLAVFH